MPRPTRSQGRDGTPVIPADWETSHAMVVAKTATTRCRILPPTNGSATPAFADDLSYTPPAPGEPLYQGPARVQVLKDERTDETGAQSQTTARYLVAIDRGANDIPPGAVIQFTAATDPDLLGNTRLYVKSANRGSLRFERDLFCVDDLSQVFEGST